MAKGKSRLSHTGSGKNQLSISQKKKKKRNKKKTDDYW